MGVFDERIAFKRFEYPEVVEYKKAIYRSFWVVDEFKFQADVHDFRSVVSPAEREAVKRTLLAISQVEVAVKRFWGKLGERFPKPEIEQVGFTFAESEVRHADAYSRLLTLLDLDDEFDALMLPGSASGPIRGRVDYLRKWIGSSKGLSAREFMPVLALFSLIVENVSLFGQFAVVQSFHKHRKVFKDIDNVIQATRKEESVHANFGAALFRIVERENPEWFDADFDSLLREACLEAYEAESAIVRWILGAGEFDFLRAETLEGYVRHRFNLGMRLLGRPDLFDVPSKAMDAFSWFDEEEYAEVNTDQFNKRPVTYSKKTRSIRPEELFR